MHTNNAPRVPEAQRKRLPSLPVASVDEVPGMIDVRGLAGSGIGLVDAGLVASCLLVPGTTIWTRDRRLRRVAEGLGVAWQVG